MLALALIASVVLATTNSARAATGAATGLGQTSGLLPRAKLTMGSAIQVDLSKQTVRLPIYPGKAPDGSTVTVARMRPPPTSR